MTVLSDEVDSGTSRLEVRKRVTIVTCAYNEEECIDELARRLVAMFDANERYEFDVVAVDNGSHDATLEKLLKARASDDRFRIVELSRNFKTDGGLLAGLSVATGDAVVLMAADLQDPPEMIPSLLEKWEEGYENVYPVIRKRLEMGWLRRTNSHLFYWVIGRVSDQPIPADANDFRLLDRRVYESVRDMDERNRFLRGLIAWSGFRSVGIEYDRPDRYAGKSKAYSLLVMELAIRAILAHTLKPLAAAPILGTGLSVAGIVTFLCVFATWLAGSSVHLSGVIAGASLLISGVLFTLVGVIGMYVGLIYEQVRGRPNFVVRNLIGIETPHR